MLPGLSQFRDYRRGWLRGDILAGLTVAAYLVPQVMAYAELAGESEARSVVKTDNSYLENSGPPIPASDSSLIRSSPRRCGR